MKLVFSEHALLRLEERGFTLNEVQVLWDKGLFVIAYLEDKEQHYVVFIPEKREFYLLVIERGEVKTLMPLIWRERSIANTVKLEAYNRAYPTEKVEAAPKEPENGNDPVLHVRGLVCNTREWRKIGKWKMSVPRPELLKAIAESVATFPLPISCVSIHGKKGKFQEFFHTHELEEITSIDCTTDPTKPRS